MERVIDRLDKYMEYKRLNDNQVTVSCKLSVGLINQARKGKSDIGKKSIEKILTVYDDINRVWLLTGEGEMLSGSVTQSNHHGDNIHGTSVTVNKTEKEYLDIIRRQSEQLSKSQQQIDRLLSIIESQKQ